MDGVEQIGQSGGRFVRNATFHGGKNRIPPLDLTVNLESLPSPYRNDNTDVNNNNDNDNITIIMIIIAFF